MEAGRAVGAEMTPAGAEILAAHARWLIATNRDLNLTAITAPGDVLRLHVQDSLVALPEVLAAIKGPMLDLGTGGGYPGIPLAVVTGRQTTLLDSTTKKTIALDAFLASHPCACGTAAERAEVHGTTHAGAYAVVLARAVAELPALIELASPLLMVGGVLVALKGVLGGEELARGERVAEMVGMRQDSARVTCLPGEGEARTVVVFKKAGESRVPLPRRPGQAQKRPLA
jgi:16S rRNA (guanine527-N7)-methyltransferase